MAEGQAVDPNIVDLDVLTEWMDTKELGSGPLEAVEPLAGGTQNLLLKFDRAGRSFVLRRPPEHKALADDSIVMCSFGDASSNHSTAPGAINSACWKSFQSIPLPLLFVCEDNGIGISTRTPDGWIAANFAKKPGLKNFSTNGLDIFDTFRVASEAADFVHLGHQVTDPYDYSTAVRTATRELMPDSFIILGPGSTLGGATAQYLIKAGWRGWDSKSGFQESAKNHPSLLSMGRPDFQKLL